jgi:Replication-relaxation
MQFRVDIDDRRFEKLTKLAEKRGLVAAELACQIVRTFTDRHGPRREALQAYDHILTKRQRDVLWCLFDFLAMTSQQISRIFSSSPENEGTYTSKCVNTLVELDLVERHDLDFQPHAYSRTVFTLAPQTVYVLEVARRGPRDVRTVRRPYPPALLEPYRLPHHLAVIDTAVAFKALRNLPFGELVEFDIGIEYRFPWLGSLRRIRPDGHGLWDDREFLHSFIVEVVRSRQLEHLIRKVRAYCYWQQSKAFQRDEGTYTVPPVLFMTSPRFYNDVFRGIVHGVLAAHETVQAAARNLVFAVALLDDLVAEGPCANVWSLPLQGVEGVTFQELLLLLGNKHI